MKIKNHTKTIVAILTASIILCSAILIPTMAFRNGPTPAGATYGIFEGVAGNDYYDSAQYSYLVNQQEFPFGTFTPANETFYADKSLRVGMTAYGEFSTPTVGGIAYGQNASEWQTTESWASLGVSQKDYIQGWVLYINYTRQTRLRSLEAWALYSNFQTPEGGRGVFTWDGRYTPDLTAANLTQGSLSTSGIKVVYDSARLVVATTTVTIHDAYYNEDICQITFTLVFNKDSKDAIVYKDYKTLLDPKDLDNINDFAFSERYELDLARGVNPQNAAFVHYYHDYSTSSYTHPLTGENSYDLLQAFDPNRNYIFFYGCWPPTTEYSVYSTLVPDLPNGLLTLLPSGTAQPDIPLPTGEPSTPWVITQWRYNNTYWPNLLHWLAKQGSSSMPGFPATNQREMRFVETFGMTDYNNATGYQYLTPVTNGHQGPALDINAGDAANQVDAEVDYIVNKVFAPEDISDMIGTAGTDPFMWIGIGQPSAAADSAGAGLVSLTNIISTLSTASEAFMLFDKNDSGQPFMKGTIPYGLSSFNSSSYTEQFSNVGKNTGNDTTTYTRTGLNGFAFGTYDGESTTPQPIAGGYDIDGDVWYPSKDPLTETWTYPFTTSAAYDSVTYHPNGIITLGGMKANGLTRYFNDFDYAISREGTTGFALVNGATVTGSAPTSDPNQNTFDYYPISTWNSSQATFGYTAGYAIISAARDINGTRGLTISGWDARDTFWAAAWASQYLGYIMQTTPWIPAGTVALILHIVYSGPSSEPTGFTIVSALGTITELGTDAFTTTAGYGFDTEAGTRTPPTWDGTLTALPTLPTSTGVWWYGKLPTSTDALVRFDG